MGWRPGLVGTAVVPGGHDSQAGYTLEAGAPVVVDDLPAESRFHGPALLFEHGVMSGMSVVIAGPRHPYGVLGAHTRRRRRFTADDVHFLQATAHVLATAILRRRDEEELARRGQELEQALRLRDDFLSIASHELKTPITSIKAYAQLLARQVDTATNERARRGLRTILRQSDQLTALINELLDVTRIESGRLELLRAPVDLTDLLTEVVGQMQLLSDAHPVQLSVAPPPPIVEGDAERLRQVLVNLLENAVKYTPEGGTVDVRLTSADGEATITVHDDGIGIPADQLPHIFDRFYRARNAATPHYTGLGLGLHISREITLRHGGRITVDSVEGAGSTFALTLPLAAPPDAG